MNEVLGAIGDAGFTVATISANLFIVLYLTLARPWKTVSGIHIFSFMLVVAGILNHATILLNFPKYPGHLWVRAFLYVALAIVTIWRVLLLLRVQMVTDEHSTPEESKQ